MIPDEGISGPYYTPLVIAGILYLLLRLGASILGARDRERGEKLEDLAFGVVLLTAAYVVVMVLAALFDKSDLVFDMVKVIAIMLAFFALLLIVMLVVFERGIGGLSRLRRRG